MPCEALRKITLWVSQYTTDIEDLTCEPLDVSKQYRDVLMPLNIEVVELLLLEVAPNFGHVVVDFLG